MPYTIKHKSQNECLIEYIEDSRALKTGGINLTMIVLGGMAVMIGADIIVVFCILIIIGFWRNLTTPPRRGFEIELNRPKNRIAIRNTNQAQPKSTIYPLGGLKGFGFYEDTTSKKRSQAQLFFKFDDTALDSPLAKKSNLIQTAKRTADAEGGFFWRGPIRENNAPTPLNNAAKIIAETDEWLEAAGSNLSSDETFEIDAAPEEAEVFRDFRDME